jgi:hypothetical protein
MKRHSLGGEEFVPEVLQAFEKEFFKTNKGKFICLKCKSHDIVSNGIAGNPNQFGVKLIQAICKNCNNRKRLAEFMSDSTFQVEWDEYSSRMRVPIARSATSQLSVENSQSQNVEIDIEEEVPVSGSQDNALSQILIRMKLLEDKVLKLEQENEAVKAENAILKEQNALYKKQLDHIRREEEELDAAAEKVAQELGMTSEVEIVKEKPAPKTFAAVASTSVTSGVKKGYTIKGKGKSKQVKKRATQLFTPVGDALSFARIQIKIMDTRPMKKAKNAKEKNAVINAALKQIGIRDDTILFSMIGNSVVELYIKANKEEEVLTKLNEKNIEVERQVNPMSVPTFATLKEEKLVSRLGWLYYHSKLINLKNCILEGLTGIIKEKVIGYVPAYLVGEVGNAPSTSVSFMETDINV